MGRMIKITIDENGSVHLKADNISGEELVYALESCKHKILQQINEKENKK